MPSKADALTAKEEPKAPETTEKDVNNKPQVCVFVSDGVYKYVDAE